MRFVYLHAAVFAVWMIFVERSLWPTLTLVVSLVAIFLSTFVMIGQNRQAAFQHAKADHDFVAQEQELQFNTELTRQVHHMTAAQSTPKSSARMALGSRDEARPRGVAGGHRGSVSLAAD
jgi:uncharacterized membrane protein